MKLHHQTPCNECPWRLASTQGYLGGVSAEFYTDAVMNNETPACHLRDLGPSSPETAFCVGALHVINNACIVPWRSAGDGRGAAREVGKSDACFRWPRDFYRYHTFGAEYESFLVRNVQLKRVAR